MTTEIFAFNVPHHIAPLCKTPFYIEVKFAHTGEDSFKILEMKFFGYQVLFIKSPVDLVESISECIKEKLQDFYAFQKDLN